MSEAVRQRYALATGKGLTSEPSSKGSPGFKKGGKVTAPMKKPAGKKGNKRGC